MNGREVNDSSGRIRDRRRSWLRWAAALTAVALIGLLATACGGGSSPDAATAGGATRVQAALAYARCMRSNGVPNFPDPDNNGDFHLGNNQQGGGSKGSGPNASGSNASASNASGSNASGSNSVSSQETAANQVCNHLLNVGSQLNAAQNQHALSQLVKYAQCMRAHGVPNFADPQITTGGIGVPSGFSFDMSHIDQKSPQYQAAARACQSIATHAKG